MRYLFLLIAIVFFSQIAIAQNVGIGTTTPQEQLHTTGKIRHDYLKWRQPQAVYVDTNGNLYTQYKSIQSVLGINTNYASITDFAFFSAIFKLELPRIFTQNTLSYFKNMLS